MLTACGILCSISHFLGPLSVRPPWLLFRLATYDHCDYFAFNSEVPPPGLYYLAIVFIVLRVPNPMPASSIVSHCLQRTVTTEYLIYAGASLISASFITLVNGVSSGPLSETWLANGFCALHSTATPAHLLL